VVLYLVTRQHVGENPTVWNNLAAFLPIPPIWFIMAEVIFIEIWLLFIGSVLPW
jgi:hypothetical protein